MRMVNRWKYEISMMEKISAEEKKNTKFLKVLILKRAAIRKNISFVGNKSSEKLYGLIKEYDNKANKRFNKKVCI